MARSRNIKPGFFANEDLVELSFGTRLFFIGLWTLADRAGRLEDRPKRIKMALFPADDFDVDAALNELQASKFLLRYEVDGEQYIQVLAFTKHQHPHKDEKASEIPAPCEHHASTVQAQCLDDCDTIEAGLVTDSFNPVTDSLKQTKAAPPAALPDWLDREAWGDWIEHRKAKKSKMTPKAEQLCIADLGKLRRAGHDPKAVIEHCIKNGWTGIFPPKPDQQARGSPHFSKQSALEERNREAGREFKRQLEREASASG